MHDEDHHQNWNRDRLRLDASAARYVFSLPVPELIRKLGPERVKEIVRHNLEEFRSRQAAFSDNPTPARQQHQQEEPQARRETISSAEVDRRLRELSQSLK